MRQILTIPSLTDQKIEWYWKYLPKLLYILPVIVQSYILYNDFDTLELGMSLSRRNTLIVSILSSFFLVIMLFLTYKCIAISLEIDRLWEKNKIKNNASH